MSRTEVIPCQQCGHQAPIQIGQACPNCQQPRYTDADWQKISHNLPELQDKLNLLLQQNPPDAKAIQPIWQELTLLGNSFDFLVSYIQARSQEVAPILQSQIIRKQQLRLNAFILMILLFAPILALSMGADFILILMLCLPVGGWFWLGIWKLWKG